MLEPFKPVPARQGAEEVHERERNTLCWVAFTNSSIEHSKLSIRLNQNPDMSELQLEIIEQGQHDQSLKDFWLKKWNLAMKKLVGEGMAEESFYEQSYFYVLKYKGKIIGVMSSTWQDVHQNLASEHYYSAYPKTIEFLMHLKIKRFHKMGMIIADLRSFPKGLKFTPIIVGCGLNFVFGTLVDCESVISFPRIDTTVFQSCLDWGSESIQSGLTLYECPVNLIYSDRKNFKVCSDENVRRTVTQLLETAIVKTSQYTSVKSFHEYAAPA